MIKQTIQRYDIMIKDLVSGEEQGFILAAGKNGPSFSYSTLPPIVAKNQQGEITMGDLTNTSVFVQYNRSGQLDYQTAIGPRGIKYWTPKYNYSQLLPTSCYRRGEGIDTSIQDGELRLAYGTATSTSLPSSEMIKSYCYDDELIYVGTKENGKIYTSGDNGGTRSLLVDLSIALGNSVVEVQQLLIIKNKYVKKLGILAKFSNGEVHPCFWTISDKYGFDLLKDLSETYYNEESNIDERYSEAPESIGIGVLPNINKTGLSTNSSFDAIINISEIKPTNYLLVNISETISGTVEELKQVGTCNLVEKESGNIETTIIHFKNFTGLPQIWKVKVDGDYKEYTIPNNSIVVSYVSIDYTKEYELSVYNKFNGDSTGVYPLMETIYGRVYKIDGSNIYTREVATTVGLKNINFESNQCVAILLNYSGGSLLGTKFDNFTIIDQATMTDSIKELVVHENRNFYIPENVKPKIILANTTLTDGSKNINRLQRVTTFDGETYPPTYACQLIKLAYDSTKADKDQYLGIILYEPLSKIQYKVVPLQALALTDWRILKERLNYNTTDGRYYSSVDDANYLLNNKYTIHGFEDDVPSHMVSNQVPISLGYDDIEDITYFFTKKANGSDTVTMRRSTKDGFQKELDFPGVGLAVGCKYSNRHVYRASKDYGYIYKYSIRNGQVKIEKVYTGLEAGNENTSILDGIIFEGYYTVFNKNDKVGYGMDILDDTFIEKFKIENFNGEAKAIIPAGQTLLIQDQNKIVYKYNKTLKSNRGFLISSIYGGMLGTVKKNCIQARMLVKSQIGVGDKGQKFRLAVSDDEGLTFKYLPRVLGYPLIPDNFTGLVDTEYEYTYDDILGDKKNECIFWFPYEYVTNKICYKIEMYRGTGELHEIVVSHIEIHFLLQSFKELVLNLAVNIFPKQKLLDASIEHTPNSQWIKMNFLRNIWENGNKVEITLPRGEKYYGVPFAIPNTGNDGFNIIAIDQQEAKKDLDNIGFMASMVFKSIVQLTKKTF